MKAISGARQIPFKNQQNVKPNTSFLMVRENKGATPQAGKALEYDAKTDTFTVENSANGQIEKWPKKETVGMQGFLSKKEKQLTVASQIITYQAAENEALKKENQQLKAQAGKNLNLVG